MKVVAFDTETRGLDWFDEDQRAFLATWADENGEYAADLSDPAQAAAFIAALDEADVLVAHNLPFDAHQVRETLGYDVTAHGKVLHDTDLLSRVMFPEGQRKGSRGGHGLKNCAERYLSVDAKAPEDAIKEMAKSIGYRTLKTQGAYYDVWRAYPEAMERYAVMDARYTWDLFDLWRRQIGEADATVYRLEQAVQPILINAERIGVALDQEVVSRLHAEYTEQAADAHAYLLEHLGEDAMGASEFDPDEDEWEEEPEAKKEKVNKTEALRQALLNLGVPLTEKTKTGLLATNKFALQKFEDEFPQIERLFEWRRLTKFLSTYLDPMEGREVVHTSFNQCGAWTGRMSSRRPNMQNIPKRAGKEVRAMFVPRPGYSFVVYDYDSIEARLIAYYLGSRGREYADMIENGYDVHAWMATHCYGGAYDYYVKGAPGEPERDIAKNTTYAISYGAGARRVSDMNKMTPDEARALISKIKTTIPGFRRLERRVRKAVETRGYVTTLMGRRNPVNPEKSYVGLNALIQGSAADVMKRGLVNTAEAVQDLGGYPLLVVHDEVVVEVPSEHAEEAARRTKAALEAAADIYPRLVATGDVVTTNYAEA